MRVLLRKPPKHTVQDGIRPQPLCIPLPKPVIAHTDRLPPIHFFLDVAPRNLFPMSALNVASSGPLDGSYLKRFFMSRMGMTLREWRSSH